MKGPSFPAFNPSAARPQTIDPALVHPTLDGTPSMILRSGVGKVFENDGTTLGNSMAEAIDRHFASVRQEGDVVREYADIGALSGWAGYVLLRGDAAVARMVTVRS